MTSENRSEVVSMGNLFVGILIGVGIGLAGAAWVHTQAMRLLAEGKSLLGRAKSDATTLAGDVKQVETAVVTAAQSVERKL
jgi:hypothetical protein